MCFDVPNGRLTQKAKLLNSNDISDEDLYPWAHPYYIVDPFDKGHNPGKQVKFGRVDMPQEQMQKGCLQYKTYSTLYKEYVKFFKDL